MIRSNASKIGVSSRWIVNFLPAETDGPVTILYSLSSAIIDKILDKLASSACIVTLFSLTDWVVTLLSLTDWVKLKVIKNVIHMYLIK